ncbi:MAG TPA: PIN domain-containing protein [Acidimicrobiales bacterium]|nr:PIN domain-containing protein [Acidimicrobiales bacterium]
MLVDTGPLLAAADRKDPAHAASRQLLESHPGPLVTTAPVVTEAGWLLDRQLGAAAEATFYRAIAQGEIVVQELTVEDWDRIAELVDTYADLHLGGVDASLVAVAERLVATDVATLDRRHFSVVRPRHVQAFNLLP